MKVDYIKNGDYFLPNLKLKKQKKHNLNKYGLLKLDYIKNHKKVLYNELIMTNKLNNFLFSVGKEAAQKVDYLVKSYVENDKELTEKLKKANQLEWVGRMNNYKNMAEEIVLNELIYN
jgi:hypothetical protein